ncbi:hypothetical protein EVAR_102676_1 [Eumeta japonica]|uniref:Uncharacterized protein n=1 Tax=Eumeta variegata TaxID=151549 RepID=A0A4C1TUY2_EUMVA|nr:hypothetical protein EVAR_102676_1 [Eumeta japonica]
MCSHRTGSSKQTRKQHTDTFVKTLSIQYRCQVTFLIASRHKLIPSVYASYEVKSNEMRRPEAISYSEPTYTIIPSGKHSSPTCPWQKPLQQIKKTHGFSAES